MENKLNDAAHLNPEDSNASNGQLVEMNLVNHIEQVKNETSWKDSDRHSTILFKSETMRIVLMGLHENAELKTHKANGVISVQVLEGKMNFITEQQTVVLENGQMIALKENIQHSVLALKETFFLLTLSVNR